MKTLLLGLLMLSTSAFADVCGKITEIKVISAQGSYENHGYAYVGIKDVKTNSISVKKVVGEPVVSLLVSAKLADAEVCLIGDELSLWYAIASLK